MQNVECMSIGFRSRLVTKCSRLHWARLGKLLWFSTRLWCKPQLEKERSIQSLTETCQVALVRYKLFAQPTEKIPLSFAINYSKYPNKYDDRGLLATLLHVALHVTCNTNWVFLSVGFHSLRKKWTNSHFESLHIVNRWTLNKIIVES